MQPSPSLQPSASSALTGDIIGLIVLVALAAIMLAILLTMLLYLRHRNNPHPIALRGITAAHQVSNTHQGGL
jgi:Na+/serine symporter